MLGKKKNRGNTKNNLLRRWIKTPKKEIKDPEMVNVYCKPCSTYIFGTNRRSLLNNLAKHNKSSLHKKNNK